MFTILDLQIAKNTLAKSRKACRYSPENNEVSYELYTLNCHDQGVACELMVIDNMELHGVDVEHMGGSNNRHDISLYVAGQHKKAEVKSAVLGVKNNKFYFKGIKKDAFNILFLCFIHPEKGVIVKTVSHDAVMEACKDKTYKMDRKTGKVHGYDIYFNESMVRKDMTTIYWNPNQPRMEVTA